MPALLITQTQGVWVAPHADLNPIPQRPSLGANLGQGRGSLGLQQGWGEPPEPDSWLQSGERPWAGPVDVGLGWWPGGLLPWIPATLRQWEGHLQTCGYNSSAPGVPIDRYLAALSRTPPAPQSWSCDLSWFPPLQQLGWAVCLVSRCRR